MYLSPLHGRDGGSSWWLSLCRVGRAGIGWHRPPLWSAGSESSQLDSLECEDSLSTKGIPKSQKDAQPAKMFSCLPELLSRWLSGEGGGVRCISFDILASEIPLVKVNVLHFVRKESFFSEHIYIENICNPLHLLLLQNNGVVKNGTRLAWRIFK